MIQFTLSLTDLIKLSSFTEKFQQFTTAVARICVKRLDDFMISNMHSESKTKAMKILKQKSDLICGILILVAN